MSDLDEMRAERDRLAGLLAAVEERADDSPEYIQNLRDDLEALGELIAEIEAGRGG